MKELSKLSIELEINFKMDILKVSKAKARKGGIKMNPRIENLKGKLIVSCQALPDEPLHSSFIMGRMALAAKQGGASGIRANTPEDIKEIKTQVDLPVIGIIKRNYDDCEIYITPTIKEVDELMEAKPEIIALDATISSRPNGQTLDKFFHQIKEKYPDQLKNHPFQSKTSSHCRRKYQHTREIKESVRVRSILCSCRISNYKATADHKDICRCDQIDKKDQYDGLLCKISDTDH